MLSLSQVYPTKRPSHPVGALWSDFKSICHLLCVGGTPRHSVLLDMDMDADMDMDMDASVDKHQQHGGMGTCLLLSLWHTRAGTAALQRTSAWVFS